MNALPLIGAGLLCYAGFACLALAMPEHWERLRGRPGAARGGPALRVVGLCLLALALGLCLRHDGPGFGSLLWMLLISAAALAVAFTLSWHAARR